MSKILILGGTGMLGHKLVQRLSKDHEVGTTIRAKQCTEEYSRIASGARIFNNVDLTDFNGLQTLFVQFKPDVVINAAGVIRQIVHSRIQMADMLLMNSVLPHKLANMCDLHGGRLITISTDYVFSGKRGNYAETDDPDAVDDYARTKLLGEVTSGGCLTIRTAIIGRQLEGNYSLLEWFLSESKESIPGFNKAIFSGVTANYLSRVIQSLVENFPELDGLYHLSSEPISKYDLLIKLKELYDKRINIYQDNEIIYDRSLNGAKFHAATKTIPETWESMLEELKRDTTTYHSIKQAL